MVSLRSKVRRKLLGYYFTNPEARHYLRELSRVLAVDPRNLLRELSNLERKGLFVSERRGRERFFRLNRKFPLYAELRGIVFKTVGVVGRLRETLPRIPGIRAAYLYGSFARNQQDAASDIDLLLVGRVEPGELEPSLRRLERSFGREINCTLWSPEEFHRRRADNEPYFEDIWRQKKITLVEPH